MTIEEQLRQVLTDPSRELPGWPDAVSRVHAGIRRRRRRRLISVVAAVIASLAVAGGVGSLATGTRPQPAPVPTAPGDVIAWADLPIHDIPAMSPRPETTPCRVAGLRFDGIETNGAGGTSFHTVRVVNQGTSACTAIGTPSLAGRDGRPLPTGQPLHQPDPAENSTPATIEPGEAALANIETYGGCLDGRRQTEISGLSMRLADGTGFGLGDLTLNTTCGLAVGPWFREALQTPPGSPMTGLRTTIERPAPVRLGGTLRFIVTLANPTAAPVVLDPCPNYMISINAPIKAAGVHQLNCVVTQVPAHGSLRFAMELPIPDYPSTAGKEPFTGTAPLTWSADVGAGDTLSASTEVTITR